MLLGPLWRPAGLRVKYMVPVILLSDGLSCQRRGSQWRIPHAADIPEIPVKFATEPNSPAGLPALQTRIRKHWPRPWAVPGTPAWNTASAGWRSKTRQAANTNYETAESRKKMVLIRAAKVAATSHKTFPDISNRPAIHQGRFADYRRWGSTHGAITGRCEGAAAPRGAALGTFICGTWNPACLPTWVKVIQALHKRFSCRN